MLDNPRPSLRFTGFSTGTSTPYTPTGFGEIYDSGLSGFDAGDLAITGTGISVSGGNIVMVNGSTNFDRYVELAPVSGFNYEWHNFESWTQWVKFSISARTAASFGVGIGVKGNQSFAWSNVGQYGLGNDVNADKALMYFTGLGTNPFTTWQRTDTTPIYTALAATDYWKIR